MPTTEVDIDITLASDESDDIMNLMNDLKATVNELSYFQSEFENLGYDLGVSADADGNVTVTLTESTA